MTDYLIEIGVVISVVIGRVMSHFEHKKTERDVTQIKVYINGAMEQRMQETFEKGIEKGRELERQGIENNDKK